MYKIVAFGDAGGPTGFERVARGVLTHLAETGFYEVIMYGLGYHGNPDMPYPFKVYPASVRGDYFGFDLVEEICKKHKPDAIWCVQDVWHHLQYCVHKPVDVPYIGYFPVDSPNMKWSYGLGFGCMTAPVAYTKFGATEAAASVQHAIDIMYRGAIKKGLDPNEPRQVVSLPHPETQQKLHCRLDYLAKWQNVEEWQVIPHGLDPEKFKPMDKHEARQVFELEQDAFIVGNINTNQFRKQQDRTFRIFSILAAQNPKARLLLYCTNTQSESGYDLHQLAEFYGVHEKTYFVHDFVTEIDDISMRALYSACDVMINTAGGEGWGLTAMESAACGVPQMVPDWSSTREIWKGYGILMPVGDYRVKEGFTNICLAEVDIKKSAELLLWLASDSDILQRYSNLALACAAKQVPWKDIGKQFEYTIRRAIGTFGPPATMSLNDVLNARQSVVKSELAGAVYLENGQPVYMNRD